MTNQDTTAHDQMATAPNHDLKRGLLNANLGLNPPLKQAAPTIEDRLGDLRADALQLAEALARMQSALALVKSKL